MYSERMLVTTRKVKSRNGGYLDIWGNPNYHVFNRLNRQSATDSTVIENIIVEVFRESKRF